MAEAHFSPELFKFLKDLAANNERDWFQANKALYEKVVVDPALRFISDVGPGLREISPHVLALPKKVGGSLFRIYRDVRFSNDKSPYKTHVGIQFRHKQAKDAHAPGFYLHLEPGQVFVAAGVWHPPGTALKALRQAMIDDPAAWEAVRDDPTLQRRFAFAGESLKTAPRGVDSDHPLIEDLKRNDLMVVADLDEKAATSPKFLDRFLGLCRDASPLNTWICQALDVPF